MAQALKIGIVIADDNEYLPIVPYVEKFGGEEITLFGVKGHKFKIEETEYISLLSGCGKANAAAATAYLIAEGANVIVNAGLSGGISGVSRGDLIVGTEFSEHDFDLTVFGYKIAEKPGQGNVRFGNNYLNSLFCDSYPEIKMGKFVTGDSFISEETARKRLRDEFFANACDMETAAIAWISTAAGVPFVSLRRVSDDAGEGATVSYRNMYHLKESTLIDVLMEILPNIDRYCL